MVSQPKPADKRSPYYDLAEKQDIVVDFRQFIQVEGVDAKEFRKLKINFLEFSAVIFTSKTAVDNYFRIACELKWAIPDKMKYFCISESIAFYLQKYVIYRKRKIFSGSGRFDDLLTLLCKHKTETYVVPLSDMHKPEIPRKLKSHKLKFSKALIYKTIISDLSDLKNVDYDMLIFFSPSGIRSLFQNFPDFQQKDIKIASFGTSTAKAVKDAGLRLDVQAPSPKAPSMTKALELYLSEQNGRNS